MTDSLHEKIAVVSGASAGIGFAVAKKLAAAGTHVVALGRNPEALEALKAQCPLGRVQPIAGDLNDPRYLSELDVAIDRVDYFVNNAGILTYAPFFVLG